MSRTNLTSPCLLLFSPLDQQGICRYRGIRMREVVVHGARRVPHVSKYKEHYKVVRARELAVRVL